MSDRKSLRVFQPGTIVNIQGQFFSPGIAGITYNIDSLRFKADRAYCLLCF